MNNGTLKTLIEETLHSRAEITSKYLKPDLAVVHLECLSGNSCL